MIALHDRTVTLYGGMQGVRDRGALKASLAQPQIHVFGHERFSDLYDKAAAYCFFIVRNHPFFDGNKRTGFLASLHFLRKNGIQLLIDQDEAYKAIVGVVTGEIEVEELAAIFRSSSRS